MGNYAGNFNIEDINWLAGIIDSDGSINLTKQNIKKGVNLQPKVQIYNSNDRIINNTHYILNDLGVNHHIYKSDRSNSDDGRNYRKLSYQLSVRRLSKIIELSDIVVDSMVGKRNQLLSLSAFCKYRLDKVLSEGKKCKYDDFALSFYNTVNDFNVKCNLKDYGFRNETLDWLAGFVDGDGCLTIKRIKRPEGNYRYKSYISFTTVNLSTLHNIKNILEMYKINYSIRERGKGLKYGRNRYYKCYEVEVTNLEDCYNLSYLLKSRVKGKITECCILYTFCKSRMGKNTRPYSEYSIKLYDIIVKEKSKYNIKGSSTTIREGSSVEDQDIV